MGEYAFMVAGRENEPVEVYRGAPPGDWRDCRVLLDFAKRGAFHWFGSAFHGDVRPKLRTDADECMRLADCYYWVKTNAYGEAVGGRLLEITRMPDGAGRLPAWVKKLFPNIKTYKEDRDV